MTLKSVESIENLQGKKVLLRLDLNVPIESGIVSDGFRIEKSIKTLEYLKKEGAKVIIISHIESGEDKTLLPVAEYMKVPLFNIESPDFSKKYIDDMNNGDVLMLENLRKNEGEKENDHNFAKRLADLAEVFVNEAFSVSHREHASIIGIPKLLPTYFGFLFLDEVNNLSQAFDPDHPAILVLGGVKFETKLPLIKKFLNISDRIFIGGALANGFLKEKGFEIGRSVVDLGQFNLTELTANSKITTPHDVIVKIDGSSMVKKVGDVVGSDLIVDEGPDFAGEVVKAINSSKFVLWNGPFGFTEGGFTYATHIIAKAMADSEATTIVGGGDTLSSIKNLNILDKFDFVSTGGGAMLDFLANGTLPGIDAVA